MREEKYTSRISEKIINKISNYEKQIQLNRIMYLIHCIICYQHFSYTVTTVFTSC